MAKTRYTIKPNSDELVDRDGNSLGRVVSITIESQGVGGKDVLPSNGTEEGIADKKDGGVGETKSTPAQLEREAVNRIWGYWLEISGRKQTIDSTRYRIIRNALKLVGEDAVKRALLGLTRSPFHQGQNDQRKAYMEVRFALKGRGDESDDERIEKAISWAATYAPDSAAMDETKVERYLEQIRYTLSKPHHPEKARAKAAWENLSKAGFTVVKLDKPPWARVER